MARKILYITGTRADFGLMQPVLKAIDTNPKLTLEIAATGMHLMKEFGKSIDEVKLSGFKTHIVESIIWDDKKASMSKFLGDFTKKLSDKIIEINPDMIMVLGDRGEMLAGAIIGLYNSIPVAHLHGGETTSTADESARHAITKLANIHFPATEESKKRILKMGEREENVFVCGAPGIDALIEKANLSKKEIFDKLGLDINNKTAILIQHPVTIEDSKAKEQIIKSLEALKNSDMQSVIIYPNSDAGGRKMIEAIKKYENVPNFKIFKNLNYSDFINLMMHADIMVGNSSSAIIEAPSFGLPAVNIGSRQDGRERAINILDSKYDSKDILEKIKIGLSDEFKEKMRNCINPYGKGNAGEKIAKILSEIEIKKDLIQKKITY